MVPSSSTSNVAANLCITSAGTANAHAKWSDRRDRIDPTGRIEISHIPYQREQQRDVVTFKLWKAAVLLFCILLSQLAARIAHAETSESLWKEFRSAHPLHVQAVLLSAAQLQGGRTLIIAEPPPAISLEALRKISPLMENLRVARTAVGADGWISDVIVDLPSLNESDLNDLIVTLNESVFGTAYKAYALPLPLPSPPMKAGAVDLDLQVTSGQLQKWFIGDQQEHDATHWNGARVVFLSALIIFLFWRIKALYAGRRHISAGLTTVIVALIAYKTLPEPATPSDNSVVRLSPVTGNTSITVQYMMRHASPGIYRSTPAGFVIWCIPKGRPLEEYSTEARQFALDSDLLVGAIANQQSAVLIGRARSIPVTELPPIRVETIMQLAATKQDELGQSYERNFMFAGRIRSDSPQDWAPIFLSDELLNTEFGSLLNITDQLLKSWSMHGEIKYINFTYPPPTSYPFSAPLIKELDTNSLTFNWNTRGAAYVTHPGDFEIFALNRTGALPIDYLAGDRDNVRKAEDTAYEWYSHLGDPNLARVVEYTGLYQVFSRLGIKSQTTDTMRPPSTFPLMATSRAIVNAFAQIDIPSPLDSGPPELTAAIKMAADLQQKIRLLMKDGSESQQTEFLRYLSDPTQYRMALSSKNEDSRALANFAGHFGKFVMEFGDLLGIELNRGSAMRAFQTAARARADSNGAAATTWIKTPSVVMSTAIGSLAGGQGGHNLAIGTVEFQVDKNLALGQVRVEQDGSKKIVFYSNQDVSKIGTTARAAARAEDAPERIKASVEASLQKANAVDLRRIDETLKLAGTGMLQPGQRGAESLGLVGAKSQVGWEAALGGQSDHVSSLLSALSNKQQVEGSAAVLVVTRQTDLSYVIDGADGIHLSAFNAPAAINALKTIGRSSPSGEHLQLLLRGMDDREANGFLHSAEAHINLPAGKKLNVLREGSMSPNEIKKLTASKYDFKSAEVTKLSKPLIIDGKAIIDAEVKIPEKAWFGKHIILKFRLVFENLADASRFAIEKLQSVLSRFGGDINTMLAAQQLRRDLQIAIPELKGVKVTIFNEQSKDIYLVGTRPRNTDEISRFS